MPPAELPDDSISTIRESIADVHRMVSSLNVVFPIFFIFSHDGGGVRGRVGSAVRHFLDRVSASISPTERLITLVVDSSVTWAELGEISEEQEKFETVTRAFWVRTDPVADGGSVDRCPVCRGITVAFSVLEKERAEVRRPGRSVNAA